jgi:hypothetical protein
MLKTAFANGRRAALLKFALGPPTQVDQFMANVDMGKDVPPEAATPPMPGGPMTPPALDGHTPMPPLPSFGTGSTVAPEMAGAPGAPPPSNGMLGG